MSSPEAAHQSPPQNASGSNDGSVSLEPNDAATTNNTALEDSEEAAEGKIADKVFTDMFIDQDRKFYALEELDQAIDSYERRSGFRLVIRKSGGLSRAYSCGSHRDCCFRAKFGKIRGEDFMVLKRFKASTVTFHTASAPILTAKGRAHKLRLKGRIEPILEKAATFSSDGQPRAKDIMAAAAILETPILTYHQSYRVIQQSNCYRREQEKLSFQSIIPYLHKFTALNQGSTTRYEADNDHRITRLFVCPGIVKEKMSLVRPVMSLDAAPMKSNWGGTLYVASVRTGCDELYPVAFSIMHENENEADWHWFLELLHSSIDMLVMDHPSASVTYKYFSFISNNNGQKGLIQALEEVFPQNYFWIEGMSPHPLGRTESSEDPGLPPRYGIVASNIFDSTNSMFEMVRDGSWLHCLDTLLMKMMMGICMLRDEHKGKTGIIEKLVALLTERWENSAGFKVLDIQGNGHVFSVIRKGRSPLENGTSYTIDIVKRTCDCGEWQDQGLPCIDAMAYYRLREQVSLNDVFAHHVDKHYTHENESELLRNSFYPVCMDHVVPDKVTLPPKTVTKQMSGQLKKQRIRKRSRWAHDPERSNIVCSRCRKRGHNVRTCITRELMLKQGDDNSTGSSDNQSE